jgi:hypothetical protein
MALKGIERTVAKFTVQTAICWKVAGSNGFGGHTFEAPVDILCRWEGKSEIKMGSTGEQFASSASVLTNHEVLIGDYLLLGTLDDFTVVPTNPLEVQGAFVVRQVDKIPMVRKTDEFVRTAYLHDKTN